MEVKPTSPILQALGDKDKYVKKITEPYENNLKEVKDQVKASGEKFKALNTLKTLVQTYTKSAAAIINPINNPFANNTADIHTNDNGTGSNYVDVTTLSKASRGDFTVRVNQIATASKMVIEGPAHGGINENPGLDGTLTIVVSGVPSMVVVDPGDNASQIIDKINSQLVANGVKAKAIPIKSNGVIYIEINHQEQGANVMTFNWVQNGAIPPNTLAERSNVTGQEAIIEVDGIQISQNSNTFKDVLPGITIKALAPNSDLDITKKQTVNVVNDPEKTLTEITKFITAYNNLAKFIGKMTEKVSKTEYAETALLHNTTEILEAQALLDKLNTSIAGGGADKFSSLSQIGIGLVASGVSEDTPAGTNLLDIVDSEKLRDTIHNNFEKFTALLRGKVDVINDVANQGSVLRFSTMSKLLPKTVLNKDIAVHVTLGLVAGDVDAVTAVIPGENGGPNTNVTGIYGRVGGFNYITFPGTKLDGLNLGYDPKDLSNRVESFTVNISQGLAEVAFYESINMVSESGVSGSIIVGMEQAEVGKERLVDKQGKLEDRIKKEVAKVDVMYGNIENLDLLNDMMINMVSEILNPSA